MKYCNWLCLAAALASGIGAAELPAPATEVQIFRNARAMIRHQVDPKGAAAFTVSGNFSPLEGSLWGSANVREIRKTVTQISRKEPVPLSNITATYKNLRVTLHLNNNGKIEKVSGTVLDLFKKEQPEWTQIVTLKCSNGKILAIQRSRIVGVESDALKVAEHTVKEEKQAWAFTLFPGNKGKVTFDFISKTLGWTPAFKMMLLPEHKFVLKGAATVVNTGDELKNVKCTLWAGSPNIENSDTFSPMAIVKNAIPVPRPPQPRYARYKGKAVAARMVMDNAAMSEEALSAPGVVGNMAPFDIGTLTLKKNEALVRSLGSANGTYTNLVRWRIPARQNDNGRNVWRNSGTYTNDLWECLRFVNPFKHPIPDAAVEIADGKRVLAQIKGSWVNPGERATWEITRCRDVKATFIEQDAPSTIKNRGTGLFQRFDRGGSVKSKSVLASASGPVKGGYLNGIWYRVTDVKGQIQLKNFRKSPVKTRVEMDYFGEFVSASGKPVKHSLNHFGSLNPKNQLIWDITLKPGETRKLDFRYNIIINR